MKTTYGHLTYCTNIHEGESWSHHFDAIKKHIPFIKAQVSPNDSFGIGLRLSHAASLELGVAENLETFKRWLEESDCYVFTMNGFPYGGFHHTHVKDHVHTPDWTTQDRVLYTIQLFRILSAILPQDMEGGISTSPLSYRRWHNVPKEERVKVLDTCTWNILRVVEELIKLKEATGQILHLDIEPEPDGLLESGPEFLGWYNDFLLPQGIAYFARLGYTPQKSVESIKQHVQLCYDICHFAVGYENHQDVIAELKSHEIKIGKIQISAALKAGMSPLPGERKETIDAFNQFNESTYLHQVIAKQQNGELKRYADLPDALNDALHPSTREWRAHFHVPLFVKDYGKLQSTQEDILEVLAIQEKAPFTQHLEIETYTWEVLPDALKQPLTESIVREMKWVIQGTNVK